MKYTCNTKRFPHFIDVLDAKLVPLDLIDGSGYRIVGSRIIAFDTDSGRVWEYIVDSNNMPMACISLGEFEIIEVQYQKPLRIVKARINRESV